MVQIHCLLSGTSQQSVSVHLRLSQVNVLLAVWSYSHATEKLMCCVAVGLWQMADSCCILLTPSSSLRLQAHAAGFEHGACPWNSTLCCCMLDLSLVCMLQANAVKVSKRLVNKPRHSAQLAADIVERALATAGQQYLQTRQHTLAWWQLSLLDVKAFLILVVLAVVSLLGFLICVVCMGVWRTVKHARTPVTKQKHV